MASVTEKILREFQASCHGLSNASDDVALEDAHFIRFTELLQIGNLLDNPTICRYSGGPANQPWGLLGYSWIEDLNIPRETSEDEDEQEDEEGQEGASYRYTFVHGFFNGEATPRNARKEELERVLKQLTRFVENTLSRQEKFLVQDEHETRDLQQNLIDQNRNGSLDRIDFMIITDTMIHQEDLPRSVEINGYGTPCSIHWWDFRRWAELRQSKSKREPVDFSFSEMGYKPIAISSHEINANTACYLTMLPGGLVADLYDNFHTRLLESNVRVFLSLKRKTNRSMVETIESSPEMFLSYNNGLSATASEVTVNENGTLEAIQDFQIVNGGQTTATLYHSKKRLRKNLENVYVQLKLTVLKDAANREEAVPKISRSANTQTAIRKSDFEANQPYMLDVARIAGKTYITTPSGINQYYYFERMAGQYNEEKNKQGKGVRFREWERRFPPAGAFNKIDLGRWMNILDGVPHIAASSAEKSFDHFIRQVKSKQLQVSVNLFKTVVGFGILFRRARKICGTKNGREFPSIIGDSSVALATTIHAMGLLHHITHGRFDYHLLFDQTVSEDHFDELLKHLIRQTWDQLEKHGGTSVQEQSRKVASWNFVKQQTTINKKYEKFLEPFLISETQLDERNQGDPNEAARYFQLLQKYFGDNAQCFRTLYDQVHINPQWIANRSLLRNLHHKIGQPDARISLSRLEQLEDIQKRMDMAKSGTKSKADTGDLTEWRLTIQINFEMLYNQLFADPATVLSKLEHRILEGDGSNFDQQVTALDRIRELVEDYKAWECLSISEMQNLQKDLTVFDGGLLT